MTAVGEGEKLRAGASMKTLLLLFTKLPKVKKSCFSSTLCLSFVFGFWLIETTTTNLHGLTHTNLLKSTDQVTLNYKYMNNFNWVQGNLIYYRINP